MLPLYFRFWIKLLKYTHAQRCVILSDLSVWLLAHRLYNIHAKVLYNSIYELYKLNSIITDIDDLVSNKIWDSIKEHESCPLLQDIVDAELAVPHTPQPPMTIVTEPCKVPSKLLRDEVWRNNFKESTKGSCYCCKYEFNIFDDWHSGHIISHANGGTDNASNLRPICYNCNEWMGAENMKTFKEMRYPG